MKTISGHIFDDIKINEKSLIIDIGALYGIFTNVILEEYNCFVEAYEPSKDNFKKLSEINNIKLKYFNKAVGGFNRIQKFYVYGLGWDGGANSLINHSKGSKNKIIDSYNIEVISLNNILEKHKTIDVLKIDCEGAEIEILQYTDLKQLKKCKQITVEFHQFRDYFNVKKNDVNKILNRLSPLFDYELIKGHPDCLFTNKEKI